MLKRISPFMNRLFWALLVPGVHIFYFIEREPRNQTYNFKLAIDDLIPFNNFFIIPYVFWYFFQAWALILFASVRPKRYFQLLFSLVSGTLICDLIFYFLPSIVIRPVVQGHGFLDEMVRNFYLWDYPSNCFPSIHVLYTVLIALFIYASFQDKAIRIFTIVCAVMISIPTLFVKQHYLLDVLAGTFLAIGLFFFFTNERVWTRIFPWKL